MSDDLISRKETLETVKRLIRAGLPEEAIYDGIAEISTAFDKEKVINEIKKKMEPSIEYDGCYYFPIDEIDRIIEKGGIE